MIATLALAALTVPQDDYMALEAFSIGADRIFCHEKDQGLHRLLQGMVGWIEGDRPEELVERFLMEVARKPVRVRLFPMDVQLGVPRRLIRGQLEVHDVDPAEADEVLEQFDTMFEELGGAPPKTVLDNGLIERAADGIEARYGRLGTVGILGFGNTWAPELPAPVAEGVPTHLSLSVNFTYIREALEPLFMYPGLIETGEVFETLMGRPQLTLTYGANDERGVARFRGTGLGREWEDLGVLTEQTLNADTVLPIPGDAALAFAWSVDLAGVLDAAVILLDGVGERDDASLAQGLATTAAKHFGPQGAAWVAHSTGGLDITALVAVQQLSGEANPLDLFEGLKNVFPDEVRPREYELAGYPALGFEIPGLPIPLEPTFVVRGGYLWCAFQPSCLRAALLEESRLNATQPFDEGAFLWMWMDTPALIRGGDRWLAMGMTALANHLRPMTDIEVGPWLPTTTELSAGAQPMRGHLKRAGHAVEGELSCDPSWAVNLSGLAGLLRQQTSLIALGAIFWARMGPMDFTEEEVMVTQSLQPPPPAPISGEGAIRREVADAHLMMLNEAVEMHILQSGVAPASLQQLVDKELIHELPLDPWGRPYKYLPPDGQDTHVIYTYGADGEVGGLGEDEDMEIF